MKSIYFFIYFISIGAYAAGEGHSLDILVNADLGGNEAIVEDQNDEPEFSEVEQTENKKVCTAKDQTSLPYKYFLGLLKNKKIDITHNSKTGKILFDGGQMIGNCNDMLSFDFLTPAKGLPYLFQVSIKESSECENGKCKYTVYKGHKGISENYDEYSFEPTMDGFAKCLESAGVIKDQKLNKDKIVFVDFNLAKEGAHETANLWFSSRGPYAEAKGGKYSANLSPGKGCYYFENIKESPYTIYSHDKVIDNRKHKDFQVVCKLKNYSAINAQISNFSGYENLQNELIKIRNTKLVSEIKSWHKRINKSKNLSKLDVEELESATGDFYEYIIKPITDEMNTLYAKLEKTTNKSEEKSILAKLDSLSAQLIKYSKSPYLNNKNYKKMKNFSLGAPLEDANWRQAIANVFKTSNTAFHYAKSDNKKFRKKMNGEFLDRIEIKQNIASDYKTEVRFINQLGNYAQDPEFSNVRGYQEINQELQQELAEEVDYLRTLQTIGMQGYIAENCARFRNVYTVQACVRDSALNYEDEIYDSQDNIQSIVERGRYNDQRIAFWSRIESSIPGRNDGARGRRSPSSGQIDFVFEPGKVKNPKDINYVRLPNGNLIDPRDLERARLTELRNPNGQALLTQDDYQRIMFQRQMQSRMPASQARTFPNQMAFYADGRGGYQMLPMRAQTNWQNAAYNQQYQSFRPINFNY